MLLFALSFFSLCSSPMPRLEESGVIPHEVTKSILQDRHRYEYTERDIGTAILLTFWEQRLEYLLVNLGCHKAFDICWGRILL